MARRRVAGGPAWELDGVLVVDKPPGPSSQAVVARVREAARARRAGHAGTLDPFASGVLVVLLGRAARLHRHLAAEEKEYRAVVRLGRSTATDDPEGEVVEELPMPVGGIISEEPVPVLAEKMGRIKKAVKGLGSPLDDPLLTLQALTFTAIPSLRLRERGLLQVKTGKLVPLLVDPP